jgi:hypothetical protein
VWVRAGTRAQRDARYEAAKNDPALRAAIAEIEAAIAAIPRRRGGRRR